MKKFGVINLIDIFCILAKSIVKTYGPYAKKEDNRKIIIVKYDDGSTRTVSYPKFLMEQHLGKELDINSTVDHINFDFDDNRLENLRVLPRHEHSKQDTRRVVLIKLTCDWCHNPFERSPRLLRDKASKGNTGTFCSKSCAGKYSRQVQLGKMKRLPIQPSPASEYYRAKKL